MLTREENELLCRVGPGTPAGELLRRYWHPICPAAELTDTTPKKRLQILGEDLVLFRLPDGTYGLLAEHCAHRGVSLYYGFVEDDGVRCAYHGWKFAPSGRCLEQPFEPAGSTYRDRVCQRAYRVEKLGGLLWAYMGPEPAPLLPRWDVLVRQDGTRAIQVHPILECNWLQAMENSVDTVHTYYLHGHMMRMKGLSGGEYYYRPIEAYDFEPFEWGIRKIRAFGGQKAERETGHPLVFPTMLRVPEGPIQAMHFRVPINDTRTLVFWVGFLPTADGSIPPTHGDEPLVRYLPSLLTPEGEHELTTFESQDKMAWETQGALFDRSQEHLAASDRGIIMYRKMLREQIEVVQRGGEPIALVRDPAQNEMISFDLSQGQARPEWVGDREQHFRERLGLAAAPAR